ncbi:MAG: hypothetical protein GY851_20585 [bacterium]|nr:hypothetical protein [bacterium]
MTDETALAFDAVRDELGLGPETDAWRDSWPESQASYEPARNAFLAPETVEATCEFLAMGSDAAQACHEAAATVRANACLARLAWHCRTLLTGETAPEATAWPMLPDHIAVAPMFWAVVVLSAADYTKTLHKTRGIVQAVTVDTLQDLELWLDEYREQSGVWGFDKAGWLKNHVRGNLVRLGRLQFELGVYHLPFRFYRNADDGRVVALVDEGLAIRGDGQFDGADGVDDPDVWTTTLSDGADRVRGYPVSPKGHVIGAADELPTTEWKLVLAPGDAKLGVHIPRLGPMAHDACFESYRQAAAFFPEHFPEHSIRAYDCRSWLLDAQLADYLDHGSNIVRFQRDYYLLPAPNANAMQTYERVFGWDVTDPMPLPATTSLQRHIQTHIRNGGCWRDACGVILPDDLPHGPAHYRRTAHA